VASQERHEQILWVLHGQEEAHVEQDTLKEEDGLFEDDSEEDEGTLQGEASSSMSITG
jgi:hypothetical protein